MQGIYIIISLVNRKVYIGQSTNIKLRWLGHKEDLRKNRHPNRYLQNAWNKYGEKNFIFSVLEECLEDKLTEREQYWINFYGGINSSHTYNFREASSKGRMSQETLKLMSENTKKLRQDPDWVARNSKAIKDSWTLERRKRMSEIKTGIKWTEAQRKNRKKYDDMRRGVSRPEVGKKVSQALKGHKVSEETKEKLRQAAKKQVHKPLTDEQRKNISEAAKRGWEKRKKKQVDTQEI